MRLLLFHATAFDFTASQRSSPLAAETAEPASGEARDAVIAFIQMEPRDEERDSALLDQAVKYFRWYCRKRDLQRVILHSFAHLAEERSSPEFAQCFFQQLQQRLRQHQLDVSQTPFGWSLQWNLSVSGHAFAKTFKAL
ncbi:MAG: hypothetical protein Tsb002_21670 [Wenzhouxiangellaceae bacterium]